jgi:hypothetical protein
LGIDRAEPSRASHSHQRSRLSAGNLGSSLFIRPARRCPLAPSFQLHLRPSLSGDCLAVSAPLRSRPRPIPPGFPGQRRLGIRSSSKKLRSMERERSKLERCAPVPSGPSLVFDVFHLVADLGAISWFGGLLSCAISSLHECAGSCAVSLVRGLLA